MELMSSSQISTTGKEDLLCLRRLSLKASHFEIFVRDLSPHLPLCCRARDVSEQINRESGRRSTVFKVGYSSASIFFHCLLVSITRPQSYQSEKDRVRGGLEMEVCITPNVCTILSCVSLPQFCNGCRNVMYWNPKTSQVQWRSVRKSTAHAMSLLTM